MRRLSLASVVAVGLMVSACTAAAPSRTQTDPGNSVEVSAIQQGLPTGDCALVVKHVHRFADMQPELATTLDQPPPGTPYRVGMDGQTLDHRPVAAVSVFGENWGTEVHVVETAPDGTVEIYTNANRPRPNQSMTASFTEVGTHVIELSSASTDCTATLVFEVTNPA